MSASKNMAESAPVKDNYMLSRGFGANTRQSLQHYLWKDEIGYLLHPVIPTDVEDIRVAEIGVGTGVWLVEVARTLPPSAQLDGLDVSHAQCPPVESLPSNVSLRIHDCLSEPGSDMLEKYDIIHLQLFNSVVENNDPAPVVRNMIKMLKPGGYITWGEFDFASWKTTTASADSPDADLNKLLQYNATVGDTQPSNFLATHWPLHLPKIYAENGLTDITISRDPFSPQVTTYLLDTFMLAAQEISLNVLDHLGGGQGEVARSLIEKCRQNRRNLTVQLDRLVTIGRKPLK